MKQVQGTVLKTFWKEFHKNFLYQMPMSVTLFLSHERFTQTCNNSFRCEIQYC